MKKRIAILFSLLAVVLLLPFVFRSARAEVTSGQCGENLYWSFDNNSGLLSITGYGDMRDFNRDMYYSVPWYLYQTQITAVSFSEGMTRIGNYAFSNYTELKEILIPNSVNSIGIGAFSGCTGLTKITIGESVTIISRDSFRGCTGLTQVIIPDSVTYVYESAFYDCTELTSVTIGNGVTYIGGWAFCCCTKLTKVKIGNNVTEIDDFAFSGAGLKEVTIPDSVERIGTAAFCTESLTSVTIGKNVKKIDKRAFNTCSKLADVYYNGTIYDAEILIYYHLEPYNDPLLNATWHYIPAKFHGGIEWNKNDVKYKGKVAYVVYNHNAQKPQFIVKDQNGNVIDPTNYTINYIDNIKPGTAYLKLVFKKNFQGTYKQMFKIYLPPTVSTSVQNVNNGIQVSWKKVDGAKGYVIYRRAWNLKDAGWTTFERWNNTTQTTWTDTKVYAGTRYQYGIKAYYTDPMDNYNLGIVGPLKTTVRITTRTLNSVTPGSKKLTAKWSGSTVFTGYQVQVATDAKFTKDVKTVTVSKANTYQTAVSGLKAKTHYYVRVRSYHVFDGTTYYGGWSNVLNGKTK